MARSAICYSAVCVLLLHSLVAPIHGQRGSGLYVTGTVVRVKSFFLFPIDIYQLTHLMEPAPGVRSPQAVVRANVNKRFVLTMLRDVDGPRMQNALVGALQGSGYKDQSVGVRLTEALRGTALKGETITISYTARDETTVLQYKDRLVTVQDRAFMTAVWAGWLLEDEQPGIAEALLSNLR